ncbi:putative WD repeat-containing protein [Wickerhamomyces ciferrii]|uniref:WD repeat-containing protein n=1 Tax=Wickerhamomyces ciferrii (strain ATCC 14091 / BCRC 22168 / CBS 111 / JCM 3599 / NBRC 0793 / NRRL Y-1031 F-60-10) TaxID=1206466 RepID=K0KCE7_WICCF|nr:putative WD repeat-containing protein [Wickerhamomyces ciferrii]CCH40571.1 putative WD repeat-containing protein [Wickerhamomyces ciferrii]
MTSVFDSPPRLSSNPSRTNLSYQSPIREKSNSTLSLTSPTRLNVVHSDWDNSTIHNNLKKNPSFTSNNLTKTDRFIPSRYSSSNNRVSQNDSLPPPNASPSAHIKARSQIIYKQSVADACGLEVGQRILQYQPLPPQSKHCVQLNQNSQFNKNSRSVKSTIDPIRSRKISSNPERVLDAPGFIDDFYLNLITWSSDNYLAIALDNSCYIWNASSGEVALLTECDFGISSVRWSEDSSYLSIGKDDGSIEIWDIETSSKLRTMKTQAGIRIGAQSWSNHLVSAGAKSGEIFINDVRIKNHITDVLKNHVGEICGLEYRKDGSQFASGSNDNTVCIWDSRSSIPQFTKTTHTAAVKALAWHPEMNSLLATGGGSSDKQIHFWNTTTGARVNTIYTGSQISSLHWGSSTSFGNEIVATGGYPNNCISVYSYDYKIKVAEIENAHDSRIISGNISPDGSILATVGGDENLKFFKVFNNTKKLEQSSTIANGKNMSKIMTIR